RGREIVLDMRRGNCLACHSVPNEPEEQVQGNLGPALAGVAQRLSIASLRLRLVDSTKISPNSIMPAYYRVDNLNRVAAEYLGRPVLNALEIEDVIAYLQTLDVR
ncbi:MAG: sulfur oxidation c-type cytochrome SoxX, partial [Alphaproteobacteria bacterium]|nr:sulfur oxidation c-type cytochrome SoxX [Alphaproteobacteria bacterium]